MVLLWKKFPPSPHDAKFHFDVNLKKKYPLHTTYVQLLYILWVIGLAIIIPLEMGEDYQEKYKQHWDH